MGATLPERFLHLPDQFRIGGKVNWYRLRPVVRLEKSELQRSEVTVTGWYRSYACVTAGALGVF